MSFSTYFKASSYAMIAVATLALVLAGGLHPALALGFGAVMVLAWKLEGSKWQFSERLGLAVVLLSIPLFFLDWKYQQAVARSGDRVGVDALAHLIVLLSAIKLLQVKSDRDWVFLFLTSFFEVLLAAGLSFSPIFLATLTLYLVCALSTVIAFEIRKAKRGVPPTETRLLVAPGSRVFRKLVGTGPKRNIEASRVPLAAFFLLCLIFALALPLFLVAPRAGSAAISRGGAGHTNFIGFSDSVVLGEVGTLKQNSEIVMRVRLEDSQSTSDTDLKWRGVALDEFTGRIWRKSSEARRSEQRYPERGLFRLGTTQALQRLTTQTVFLEPLDSTVLFGAPRAVAIQGDFPYVRLDREGSIQTRPHPFDRLMYKVVSDTSEPDPDTLRRDIRAYSPEYERYQQLPALDPRIAERASAMIVKAHARNRYDAAKAIESQLRSDFGYSLQMKASGPDPLADFLFNVREGHCEYFSTAMVVMLRTHGIAARVVNGFLPGEYNETAGAFTVRQSDAHSWVEVYFPETNAWVSFDPTPAAGRTEPQRSGFTAQIGKYAEALELMWFQYVVGYDKQEQRSLATSFHNSVFDYRRSLSQQLANLQRRLPGFARIAVIVVLPLLLLVAAGLIARRIIHLGWRRAFRIRGSESQFPTSAIEFYERLMTLLYQRGIRRAPDQTPLEFASIVGGSEAVVITNAYNRVRFGAEKLSATEVRQIEEALSAVEQRLGLM
jgi:transglutaminase-like putative cysteine protease